MMTDRVETLGGTVERVSLGARAEVRAAVPIQARDGEVPHEVRGRPERVAQSSAAE